MYDIIHFRIHFNITILIDIESGYQSKLIIIKNCIILYNIYNLEYKKVIFIIIKLFIIYIIHYNITCNVIDNLALVKI